MRALAIIGARGGSKTLPGKNLAQLGGKPLLAWTIEAALAARTIERTLVTSDDPAIIEAAQRHGAEAPFIRPRELAADDTPGTDVVLHAVEWLAAREGYRPDIVVSLQPTSPLRTAADINGALALLGELDADSVVSVTAADPHPYWTKRIDADGWMRDLIDVTPPIVNRQELPPVYALNGAIYAARYEAFLRTRGWYTERTAPYVMPAERSIDIDTALDFAFAETLVRLSVGKATRR